jgi:ribosome-binding factor A
MQGSRPARIADQVRAELGELLSRGVKDPGLGFVTITQVKVTPDLQLARVFYTALGDEKAKRESERALSRALPFLRRQLGERLRLRRVPELEFKYDKSIEHQDRVERILQELKAAGENTDSDPGDGGTRSDDD